MELYIYLSIGYLAGKDKGIEGIRHFSGPGDLIESCRIVGITANDDIGFCTQAGLHDDLFDLRGGQFWEV
jgi:hypothetical protein